MLDGMGKWRLQNLPFLTSAASTSFWSCEADSETSSGGGTEYLVRMSAGAVTASFG